MAKKKKKSKVKRMVGSTPMDVMKEAGSMETDGAPAAVHSGGGDTMDTSEVVVTDAAGPSRKLSMRAGLTGRAIKKGPQKRKAAKLRKNKALEKAMSAVDKQEQRLMKQELKSFRVQTLKKMDIND